MAVLSGCMDLRRARAMSPEGRSGRLGCQQRGAQDALRRARRPPPDAAHAHRRRAPCARSTTTGPPAKVQEQGDPVLLVTPLAAPAICFDLRRGCSLVEHFVGAGRPTYLVEYGEVSFRDRDLGMEHWIDEVVPTAIREVSEHAGGRPVHVIGWSLGGIFALLTAADSPDLPIASVTAVGSPFDVSLVPLVAPLRPLLNFTEGRGLITRGYQAFGGAPKPMVKWAFQLSSFQKLVTKPIAHRHPRRRRGLPGPDRGGRPVHREHDRLPRPHLRPALPPVREGQRAGHRPVRPRRPHHRDRRHRGTGPGVRRSHRRHRTGAGGQGGGAASLRVAGGALRDRAGRPSRHAHRSRGAHHHLAGDGRVDLPVVDPRSPRPPTSPTPARKKRSRASAPTRCAGTARRRRARWRSSRPVSWRAGRRTPGAARCRSARTGRWR